jgi:single-stranded-DNA-specific exonuclease
LDYKFTDYISLKGKQWRVKEADNNYCLAASQKYGVDDLVARLLYNKSVELEDIEDFLEPKIKKLMPDPYFLKDMDKAVARIYKSIIEQEKICIYGDYDVDGATSSAIIKRYFKQIGVDSDVYIPDRVAEGYGLNSDALVKLKEQSVDLVITVDCGIVSFEPVEKACEVGLDVIILDHHLSSENLPKAVAAVNPNRLDQEKGLNNLCAAGVAFLMIVALNRYLRENGFFDNSNYKEPNLFDLLDLVALGTVCDVMTLTGLNRAFVSQGLKILAKRKNRGLAKLCDIAELNKKPDVHTLGFLIGPRINAAGRIDDCSLGSKLLSSESDKEIDEIAHNLNALNHERQEIEKDILSSAIRMVEDNIKQYEEKPVLIIAGKGWHQGVIGIVAGRIKEKFDKPTAVITIDENNLGKASARSVNGVNIGAAITQARIDGILVAGGGHASAAGFTIEADKIANLEGYISQIIKDDYQVYANDNSIFADAVIDVNSVNLETLKHLEKLEPYGNGNPEPRFIIEEAEIVKTKRMGEKHLSIFIKDSGIAKSKKSLKCLCFNVMDEDFGLKLESAYGKKISLFGRIKKNIWAGYESAEFMLEDAIIF